MFKIKSHEHYERIISKVVDEYEDPILSDAYVLPDVSSALVANVAVIGDTPTVCHDASLWGETVETTDGEALNPYDVITYSQAEISPHQADSGTTESLAKCCLARDMRAERQSRRDKKGSKGAIS